MSELPQGWVSVALGLLGQWGSGGTPSRSNGNYYENGTIPWLVIGDLNDGYISSAASKITEDGLANSSAKLLTENTLLVAMYGSIGKLGITKFKCTTNQAIASCKPNPDLVDLKYFFYSLMNQKKALIEQGQGGAQQNISQGILKMHEMPLAPLPEQKRIADKLDTLLARVDATRARLDRIPELLKRFRQSVLAAATSGQLTEDWRLEQQAKASVQPVAPVHHLTDVESVDSAYEDQYEYQIVKNEPWVLPNNWKWVRAEEICELITKGTTPSKDKMTANAQGVPYIKVYNLTFDGKLDFTINPTFIEEHVHENELKRSKVYPADVLMNIVGPPLGKISVVPNTYPQWNINQAIARFRPSLTVTSGYLALSLMSSKSIELATRQAKATAGQLNLTLEICRNLPIPLPPHEEQKEIASRVDALMALANRLEAHYNIARAQVDKLTPALLAKAFRGELVPQDPNDEPAEQLLARIRAARELSPTRTTRKARTVRSE